MMGRLKSILTLFLISIVAPALAESPAPETSEGPAALLGTWQTECDAWGEPAICSLDWQSGLHAKHITVDYRIEGQKSGEAIFVGTGVYKLGQPDMTGYWSDSSGAIHPLNAKFADGVLTTHWGKAGGAQGRTEYRLTDTSSLLVTDWALTKDGWRQFMQASYAPVD